MCNHTDASIIEMWLCEYLFIICFLGMLVRVLSISPCGPDEGLGEAEDLRSLKHRAEDDDLCNGDKSKHMRSLADSELISRR